MKKNGKSRKKRRAMRRARRKRRSNNMLRGGSKESEGRWKNNEMKAWCGDSNQGV